MKKYVLLSLICVAACWSNSLAQDPDWINYTTGQGVEVLADNGNELWIGTSQGGVVKLDKTTEEMTFYNRANSGLPHNDILALASDGSQTWIGTDYGLAGFDGTNWTVYDTRNSGLPDKEILSLAMDGNGTWIGTGGGLARFDGTKRSISSVKIVTVLRSDPSAVVCRCTVVAALGASRSCYSGLVADIHFPQLRDKT